MSKERAFTFHISVHEQGKAYFWMVEDRRHSPDSDDHRTPRISMDLVRADLNGTGPYQSAWILANALVEALRAEINPRLL